MSDVLLDAGDMRRTLGRMAHEILEANQGASDLVVVGVLRRGYPVAKRLAWLMTQVEGTTVPCGKLDARPSRDDRPEIGEDETEIPFDVNGKKVVLVDEVIYTGRTTRAALDALMKHGRPREVQLAVLIDRGHRELPIQPDFCGRTVKTEKGDRVVVKVNERGYDDEDAVLLQSPAGGCVVSRNLIAIRHLGVPEIEELLSLAADFKNRVNKGKEVPNLSQHIVGMLFFENSTRTRVSFEQAARYLRMKTANFSAGTSSMSKGETLKDTILTLRYERLNGLVMRHRLSGSATMASRFFGGPVLNAGDGQHEHPTQALGDALTILERKGSLRGLTVAIVGDVEHSRVARSNAWLLHKMGAEVRFVGPRTLIPSHTGMLPGRVVYDLAAGLEDCDVVLCLRLQKERMEDGKLSSVGEYAALYQVNRDTLRYAKPDCLVMHPGPLNRGIEVDDFAADGEHSVITAQVENGVFVRMASLFWCFTGDAGETRKSPPARKGSASSKARAKP